jgi:hypothetical protein
VLCSTYVGWLSTIAGAAGLILAGAGIGMAAKNYFKFPSVHLSYPDDSNATSTANSSSLTPQPTTGQVVGNQTRHTLTSYTDVSHIGINDNIKRIGRNTPLPAGRATPGGTVTDDATSSAKDRFGLNQLSSEADDDKAERLAADVAERALKGVRLDLDRLSTTLREQQAEYRRLTLNITAAVLISSHQ